MFKISLDQVKNNYLKYQFNKNNLIVFIFVKYNDYYFLLLVIVKL